MKLDVNLAKALAYKESRIGQGLAVHSNPKDIFTMFVSGDFGDKNQIGLTSCILNNAQKTLKTCNGPQLSTYWGLRWLYFKSLRSSDGKTKQFKGWWYGIEKYGPGEKEKDYTDKVKSIFNSIR